MVARITALLSRELSRAEVHVDHELAVAGALLHDIAKTRCLEGRCNHAEVGVEICLAHGFHEVAQIVGEHVILSDFSPPQLSAKEVVYYADKRVNHDKIVSLEQRLDYIIERYGKGDPKSVEMIQTNFGKCCQIEERIFSPLCFQPSQLPHLVNESDEFGNQYA